MKAKNETQERIEKLLSMFDRLNIDMQNHIVSYASGVADTCAKLNGGNK